MFMTPETRAKNPSRHPGCLTASDAENMIFRISIVMVAFAWGYIVGVFANQNIKPIRMLKHGRKAKSFFKYGLEIIATILLNPLATMDVDVFKFLSCT